MSKRVQEFRQRTATFDRSFPKKIFYAAIAGLLIGLGFNMAKAEEAPASDAGLGYVDPYAIAQRAYFCKRLNPLSQQLLVPRGDTLKTKLGKDYTVWNDTMARATAWSIMYGYSMRQIFAVPQPPENAYGFIDSKYYEDCKLEALVAAPTLRSLEEDHYAQGWKTAQPNILKRASIPVRDDTQKTDEAAWCAGAFQAGIGALGSDPKAIFGTDPQTGDGKQKIEQLKSGFTSRRTWWLKRYASLAADKANANILAAEIKAMNAFIKLIDRSGLQPSAPIKQRFVQQEIHICDQKFRALDGAQ